MLFVLVVRVQIHSFPVPGSSGTIGKASGLSDIPTSAAISALPAGHPVPPQHHCPVCMRGHGQKDALCHESGYAGAVN